MPYKNPEPTLGNVIKSNEETSPDYTFKEKVYFAFIDVLGFKQTFEDIKTSSEPNRADKFRNVFNYYFELMNSSLIMKNSRNGCYAGQTSDSLYFYTEREDFLLQFIKIFSYFSLYSMTQDVFFRGGIAKGALFQKEDYQFYGDSVIYAYQLESNVSKYPIVVIDKKTYSDLTEYAKIETDEMVDIIQNRYFIKPFIYSYKNIDFDVEKDVLKDIEIKMVVENIRKNMERFEYDPKNYEKYAFLDNELRKKAKRK